MTELKSQIAYLSGLASGLDVNEETKEGKLLLKIVEVMECISEAVEKLEDSYNEVMEYAEAIDHDLTDLEKDYYEDADEDDDFYQDDYDFEDVEDVDDEEDMDEDEDDDFYQDDYDSEDVEDVDDEEDMDEDEDYFTVECPDCKEIVYLDEDLLEDGDTLEILCPQCERVVFVNEEKDKKS